MASSGSLYVCRSNLQCPSHFMTMHAGRKKNIDVQLLPFMNKNLLATVKRAAQYVQKREGDLLHQNISWNVAKHCSELSM